jgi:hypothetical protein
LGRIRKNSATAILFTFSGRRSLEKKKRMTTFTEKPAEITKQEWMEKLENVHLQRTDMNRLVMNYLVTGMIRFQVKAMQVLIFLCFV